MMMKTASTPRVGGLRSSKQFSEGRLRTFRATRASVDGSNNAADAASADKAVTRRALVGLVAGASALAGRAAPSLAAYGEAANVFGGFTGDKSGFTKYEGDGYSVLIPAKWNPSKEKDFPGTDLRYEDNFDAVNNLTVTVNKSGKSKISDYGSPDDLLAKNLGPYLGETAKAADFESASEGGFAKGTVAQAALLDSGTRTDGAGKLYYTYEILTRTADGNEGGRHQLFAATVSRGNLYVIKVQAGDKRWFKGEKNACIGSWESFTVA